jgi:putative methionine-R-sulfoxide reductase with GAF domain
MERYSLFDVQPSQPERPAEPEAVRAAADAVAGRLKFPPEDAGASLAEMAQRDLAAALQLLCERAQYITAASGAAIALRDAARMVCCASAGPSAPELGAELTVNSGLSGESVRTRQILRCDNAESDARVNRESCRALGIASVVVLPVVANDDVIGVFELFSSRPYAFEERDIVALQRLAEMIQTALEQAEAVKRGAKEIAKTEEPPQAQAAIAPPPPESPVAKAPVAPVVSEPAAKAPEAGPDIETAGAIAVVTPAPPAPEIASAPPTEPVPPPPAAEEKSPEPAVTAVAPLAAKPAEPSFESVSPILPEGVSLHFKIGKCATCGFPVSEGRTICIDCEKKAAKPDAGAEKAESLPDEQESGWLSRHKLAAIFAILLLIAFAAGAFFYLR